MDYDRYKLFVGGIAKETSEEALKQHFSRYGVVLEAVVAKEKLTGHPRGFGFVRFANDYDVKALRDTHVILGRPVAVKKAIRKHELVYQQQQLNLQQYKGKVQHNNGGMHEMSRNGYSPRTKKIFVGGLSSDTTEEQFKSYFEKFGRTTDVVVMHDSVTNRPRGFGFVTFDSEDSVEAVMQSNFHELSGKRVEVKRAIPKEGIQSSNSNRNVPPNHISFQATPYLTEHNGYGMQFQYPPVSSYHNNVHGFHYPYGYPLTAQVPTGFYYPPPPPPPTPPPPPPPMDAPCYFPYMNAFDPSGMSLPGYNPVAWPVAGNGASTLIHQFENLKLGVSHQTQNRGNMGKPLQNGTYR